MRPTRSSELPPCAECITSYASSKSSWSSFVSSYCWVIVTLGRRSTVGVMRTSMAQSSMIATVVAALLTSCSVGTPVDATGRWAGSYTCSQGITGLTLDIGASIGGLVPATFNFYPLPSNPDVATGSFRMSGELVDARLVLLAGEWLDQPPAYRTVDLDGVVGHEARTYSGRVVGVAGSACATFFLSEVE